MFFASLMRNGTFSRKVINFFHFFYLSFANHIVSKIPSYTLRKIFYKYLYFMKIGRKSHIQMGVRVYAPWKIKIGDNCSIGHDSLLDGRRGITIGNNVDIAGYVQIFTLGHDIDDARYQTKGAPVIIKDDVSLFSGSAVLPGVVMESGSVAALKSVITKDTRSWSLYAGVPAKFIRERGVQQLTYLHDYKRYFH